MRRFWLPLLAGLLLVGIAPAVRAEVQAPTEVTTAPSTVHPRLLFSSTDVLGPHGLRARVAVPGSVPAAAWLRLKEKADRHLITVRPDVIRQGVCVPYNLEGYECAYNAQNEMPTYLVELGMAYQLSGDPRYARHAIALMVALGDAGFPFWTNTKDLGIGDLLEGIGLAFDWTYEQMTPSERATIVGDITAYQDRLIVRPLFQYTNEASTYPASNWMGITAGGVGLTLLAIAGEPGAPTTFHSPAKPAPPKPTNVPAWPARDFTYQQYLDKALSQVRVYFRGGTDRSGASQEGHTYAAYALKNTIPFTLAAKREGLGDLMDGTGLPATWSWGNSGYVVTDLGNLPTGTGLRGLSWWLALEQLPGQGQMFVPLGDSQRTQAGVDMAALLFGINPDDGVAQWLWRRTVGDMGSNFYAEPHLTNTVREDKCKAVTEPLSFAACDLFNVHGNVWTILFYRSPAETPEVDPATVGPLSVHHAERGLVDARTGFARGQHEVISTFEAHRNGVAHFQYDAGNFTLYGEGGRWATDPGFDCVACGDDGSHKGGYADQHNVVVIDGLQRTQSADSRYNKINGVTIDRFVNAPNLSLTHADLRYAYGGYEPNLVAPYAGRDHLFTRVPGRPVILGITDHVQRDTAPHVYRWQMLTNNDNVVVPDGSGFSITAPNGAALSGRVTASGAAPQVLVRPQPITTSGDDEGKVFPVVYTETPSQLSMDQLAVMALVPAGSPAAVTSTVAATGGLAIGVTWGGSTDLVVRRLRDAAQVSGATVQTDAAIAKLSSAATSAETVMRAGTRLSAYGRDYITVAGSSSTVTASGSEVSAAGASANSYRVFAPQAITKVSVNGDSAPTCREGAYLVFPCQQPTTLDYTGALQGRGESVDVSAVLRDADGSGLSGQPVTFTLLGGAATVLTDASGRAATVMPAVDHGRSQEVVATFPGSPAYRPSRTTAVIVWGASRTLL